VDFKVRNIGARAHEEARGFAGLEGLSLNSYYLRAIKRALDEIRKDRQAASVIQKRIKQMK
jgi:hypothetical protein